MCSARDKNVLSSPIAMFRQMFRTAVLSKSSFILVYGILQNHKNGLNCSLLLHPKSLVPYYHFHTPCYIVTVSLGYLEHSKFQ